MENYYRNHGFSVTDGARFWEMLSVLPPEKHKTTRHDFYGTPYVVHSFRMSEKESGPFTGHYFEIERPDGTTAYVTAILPARPETYDIQAIEYLKIVDALDALQSY